MKKKSWRVIELSKPTKESVAFKTQNETDKTIGYCITFVYSNTKGNFIIKGLVYEVGNYLSEFSVQNKYFANKVIYHKVESRSIWIYSEGYVNSPIDNKHTNKWEFVNYRKVERTVKTFKRLPNRWVKELN